MHFKLITFPPGYRQTARFDESLIALAAQSGPVASVWEAEQGLIVPRTYRRHENFSAACETFARQAWPITVRLSGGGIVPQGPGILNLSLAYAVDGLPLDHADAAYTRICRIIAQALDGYGIATHPQAVAGSFCDGRYNLAWGEGRAARKVAGTAQLWRRVHPAALDLSAGHDAGASTIAARPLHTSARRAPLLQVVLVHALIFGAIDVQALTAHANRFEQALNRSMRYDPNRIASLYECMARPACPRGAFTSLLAGALIGQLESLDAARP
jgi:hypothetical protein